jgi:hypothetical protein
MSAQPERILITVKTYPHPSTRYEETVCTAGLALGMGKFKCCPDCPEHTMTVLDWEVFALYRKQAQRKSPDEAVRDVLQKYNVQYGVECRDLHFFVGTTIDHQSQFSIIGVYYPPRMTSPDAGATIPLF